MTQINFSKFEQLGKILYTALTLAAPVTVSAATLSSPVNISASADTFITEHLALGGRNSTHGSETFLYETYGFTGGFGDYRTFPLVKFDLTAYTNWTVDTSVGAAVRFELIGSNVDPTQLVSLRRALVAWDEATATFNTFGGSGFDESTQTGSNLVTQPITYAGVNQSVEFAIPGSVIQGWIDNPGQNFGLIMIGAQATGIVSNDKRFSSREGVVAPTLSFLASPVPEASSIALFLTGLGVLSLLVRRREA